MNTLRSCSFLILVLPATLVAQGNIAPIMVVHPSPSIRQFEVGLATDPSDPGTVLMVADAMHTSGTEASVGLYYSLDRGMNFASADTMPTHTDLTTYAGNPAAGIDGDGNMFVTAIIGKSSFRVFTAHSTDRGANWSRVDIPNPTNNHRPHMAIDVNPGSPFVNTVYVTYATINSSPIMLSRSTDRGLSFSAPVQINGSVGGSYGNAPNLAVGPDGELYATWTGGATQRPIGFNKSTDGGSTWDTPKSIRTINNMGNLTKGTNTIWGFSGPVMAIDCSSGPRRGWIYIVYPALDAVAPDIYLIRSTDKGNSWSDPVFVNQDASGKDQWTPWVSVDPSTGTLFVVYYDSRRFPNNDSAEVYMSVSCDGGQIFHDYLVSDAPFLPAGIGSNPVGMNPYNMGAYIGVSARDRNVWICWNDNRTGIQQLYASVFTDASVCAVEGIDPAAPATSVLIQNYPNPFNPTTVISYQLPVASNAELGVYDLLGREVAMLVNERKPPGSYEVTFNATALTSGVYFYRLTAGSFVQTRKMLVIK
jgi:hypothetical protein